MQHLHGFPNTLYIVYAKNEQAGAKDLDGSSTMIQTDKVEHSSKLN